MLDSRELQAPPLRSPQGQRHILTDQITNCWQRGSLWVLLEIFIAFSVYT